MSKLALMRASWMKAMWLCVSLSCSKPAPVFPLSWHFAGVVENSGDTASAIASTTRTARAETFANTLVELDVRVESATVTSALVSGPSPVQVDVAVRRLKPGFTLAIEGLHAGPVGPGATPTATPELLWQFTLVVHDTAGNPVQRTMIVVPPSGPVRGLPLRVN